LVTYNRLVDGKKIGSLVEEILKIHAPMGHSYEISWALWLAKTFNITITESTADDIFKSYDVIPILMALDLKNKNLLVSSLDLTTIIERTEDSLFEEKWILTYESIIHEWLPPITPNPLETNEYFKILKDNNIKFYDESIKAKPLAVKGLEKAPPIETPPIETPPIEIPPIEIPPEGYPEGETPEGYPEGETPEGYPEGETPEGYPEGETPEGYPEGEPPEGYPEEETPEGYPEGEPPEGYPEGEPPEEEYPEEDYSDEEDSSYY
jgi:hypothetical protein